MNLCTLGPKTEDLPLIREQIKAGAELRAKREADKAEYRKMLAWSKADRVAWLKKQRDQNYWLEIARGAR